MLSHSAGCYCPQCYVITVPEVSEAKRRYFNEVYTPKQLVYTDDGEWLVIFEDDEKWWDSMPLKEWEELADA